MTTEDKKWARDFFGPLWAWLTIGLGLLLMISTYVLVEIGVSGTIALIPFGVGAMAMVTAMAYLAIEGRKSWSAWFWMFHLDDDDLLMGRKKKD